MWLKRAPWAETFITELRVWYLQNLAYFVALLMHWRVHDLSYVSHCGGRTRQQMSIHRKTLEHWNTANTELAPIHALHVGVHDPSGTEIDTKRKLHKIRMTSKASRCLSRLPHHKCSWVH